MSQPVPGIDVANLPAPSEGIRVALFITVRKVARSRDFYSRVLGGKSTGLLTGQRAAKRPEDLPA